MGTSRLLRMRLKGAIKGTTESSLKMMKNDFHFTLKALFVLKIFKFFS